MLTSDQLSKYMENPGLLSAWSMKEIQLLTDQYPFFQTARLLEVKNFQAAGVLDLQSKLNFCAAYTADRKILYALLNLWEPAYTGTSGPSGKGERERKPTLQENIADALFAQLDISRSLDPGTTELKPNIALDLNKEYGGVAPEDSTETGTAGKDPAAAEDNTEELTAEDIIAADHTESGMGEGDMEGSRITETGIPVPGKEPEETAGEGGTDEGSLEGDAIEESQKEEDQETIIWLDESDEVPVVSVIENLPSGVAADEPGDLIVLEDSRTSESMTVSAGGVTAEEKPGEKEEKPEKQIPEQGSSMSSHDLIDRFIETNPRLTPPAEEGQPFDISADSVREDEGLLTDTLAKIYIRQGYYTKAIFTYEKLLLKFPEKSAYFAAQIEAIKNLIKKEE